MEFRGSCGHISILDTERSGVTLSEMGKSPFFFCSATSLLSGWFIGFQYFLQNLFGRRPLGAEKLPSGSWLGSCSLSVASYFFLAFRVLLSRLIQLLAGICLSVHRWVCPLPTVRNCDGSVFVFSELKGSRLLFVFSVTFLPRISGF